MSYISTCNLEAVAKSPSLSALVSRVNRDFLSIESLARYARTSLSLFQL
ncbi:MAG: hypothetical protein IJG80_01200 [Selenomonadaceae bacterium]|nr:hypothetical protein [Selenomonadaceae bacterium]